MEDLTALLLSPAPLWLVAARNGSSELLRFLIPLAHLLSFVVLTVLALMIRWPALRRVITVLLALYGGMREDREELLPPGRSNGRTGCRTWRALLSARRCAGALVRRRLTRETGAGIEATCHISNIGTGNT